MSVKLLTGHHLEFLRLKGGCTCSSEPTHVKMPHCWKAHMLWCILEPSPKGPVKQNKAKKKKKKNSVKL